MDNPINGKCSQNGCQQLKFSLDNVEYDRNYNGDIAKAMAVNPEATKDAMAMYDKLGGTLTTMKRCSNGL